MRSEQDVLLARGELVGSKPTLRSSRSLHCSSVNCARPATKVVQRVAGRHLDRPEGLDAERLPVLLLGERGDVLERDLGVEAAGQHPLVLVDELGRRCACR